MSFPAPEEDGSMEPTTKSQSDLVEITTASTGTFRVGLDASLPRQSCRLHLGDPRSLCSARGVCTPPFQLCKELGADAVPRTLTCCHACQPPLSP